MKHRLFKCGRLSGMLLGAAALLAMVPLMSVPALAEDRLRLRSGLSAGGVKLRRHGFHPYGELLELLR
ncbi:MAG: hypothetical protein ACLSG5_01845 [Oscillospiraceae bacterium]